MSKKQGMELLTDDGEEGGCSTAGFEQINPATESEQDKAK